MGLVVTLKEVKYAGYIIKSLIIIYNMLNIFNELLSKFPFLKDKRNYKYINLNGKLLYVMGFRRIIKYENEEIVLKVINGELLNITGKDLSIKDMEKTSITICGDIYSIGEIKWKI